MVQTRPSGHEHLSPGLRAWTKIRNSYKLQRASQLCLNPAIAAYRRIMLPEEIRRRQPLRVHFGCGEIADARFLNVDARTFPHIHYMYPFPR